MRDWQPRLASPSSWIISQTKSGDPNRMSFELNLNTNAELWLVGARLPDA